MRYSEVQKDVLIERIRGFSILFIVLYHFLIAFPGSYKIIGDVGDKFEFVKAYFIFHNDLLASILAVFFRFGWQFVGIFLVISGFGLTYVYLKNSENNHIFLLKRIKNIFPLWHVSILFSYIMNIVLYGNFEKFLYKNPSIALSDYFYLFLFPFLFDYGYQIINVVNDTLWYMILVFQFYLFFPFLSYVLTKIGVRRFLMLSIFVSIAYRLAIVILYPADSLPFNYASSEQAFLMKTVLARCAEFSLGMVMGYEYFKNHTNYLNRLSFLMFVVSVIIWILGNLMSLYRFGWIISDLLITVGLLNITGYLLRYMSFNSINIFFERLGAMSLNIYLFHGRILVAFGAITGVVINQINLPINLLFYLEVLLVVVVLVLLTKTKKCENKN